MDLGQQFGLSRFFKKNAQIFILQLGSGVANRTYLSLENLKNYGIMHLYAHNHLEKLLDDYDALLSSLLIFIAIILIYLTKIK